MKDSRCLISISQKTGFISRSRAVEIFDERGRLFYSFEPKNKKFNLPAGKFYSTFDVIKLPQPLNYRLPELPKPDQRHRPDNLSIEIRKNPNTASIYTARGLIIIDTEKAKEMTLPQLAFVLLHELGHLKYESEKNCDLYATRQMLKLGYNPSQIFAAAAITLKASDTNRIRCTEIFNNLTE